MGRRAKGSIPKHTCTVGSTLQREGMCVRACLHGCVCACVRACLRARACMRARKDATQLMRTYFQMPAERMHEGDTKSTSKLIMLQIETMDAYVLLWSSYRESKPKTVAII